MRGVVDEETPFAIYVLSPTLRESHLLYSLSNLAYFKFVHMGTAGSTGLTKALAEIDKKYSAIGYFIFIRKRGQKVCTLT